MIRPEQGGALRRELIGFAGIVERNMYLIRRFAWWELAWFLYTVANTLTIVFIAKGVEAAGGQLDVNRTTIVLLIGAVIWSYLGLIFEIVTETVAWERWEGTIEYTFMAPISRASHLLGMGAFAVIYGVLRTALLFAVVAASLSVSFGNADFAAAGVVLLISSVSFIGIGMMTAVLPLISPEKGTQLGFIAQGLLLVVSGVYYPVTVLPDWMQWLSVISPATYALRGIRSAILDGFTLRNTNAVNPVIYNVSVNPSIQNCTFEAPVARKYNAAIIFKRAKGHGRITRIDGLREFLARHGEHVVEQRLLPFGSQRRDWKKTLVSDGYILLRHPDWDRTYELAMAAATEITMWAE